MWRKNIIVMFYLVLTEKFSLTYSNFFQIFALAMAAVCATELGYKGYNDHSYNSEYSSSYDLADRYNNYGYNGYNNYNGHRAAYDGHRLHKRAIFLAKTILAKVPFPIGK